MTNQPQDQMQAIIHALHEDLNKYVLYEPHRFRLKLIEIWINPGFEFDGASIPRLLWSIFGHPFSPRMVTPALEHDFLYRRYAQNECNNKHVDKGRLTRLDMRKEVDTYFRDRLVQYGVSKRKAKLMYYGVRLFGWLYYNRCKHEHN